MRAPPGYAPDDGPHRSKRRMRRVNLYSDPEIATPNGFVINPRRACAARVSCVVCPSAVCLSVVFCHHAQRDNKRARFSATLT